MPNKNFVSNKRKRLNGNMGLRKREKTLCVQKNGQMTLKTDKN